MGRQYWIKGSDLNVDLGQHYEHLEFVAEQVFSYKARSISEAVCHMAAVRGLPTAQSKPHAAIRCTGAGPQDTSARDGIKRDYQAAHRLPGVVEVDSEPIWNLANPEKVADEIHDAVDRLQGNLKGIFAVTDRLPGIFNRADSQAERTAKDKGDIGLKELFGETVKKLWRDSLVEPANSPPLVIDFKAVVKSLEFWFHKIPDIYKTASEKKLARSRAPDVVKDGKDKLRALEASILNVYASILPMQNVAGLLRSAWRSVPDMYTKIMKYAN